MSSLLGQLNAREQSLFIAAIADVYDHNLHLDDKALGILLTQNPPTILINSHDPITPHHCETVEEP
ncbi:hypothetical protein FVEN_g12942 [Fusarium venenatum]|uniref:Uncharacterized protein n=2 Tax=Fusarium venenatum TaxID=56646 RepID=A0A2L2TXX2_9HYPO|nr:uncharacterized protein FVRRES_02177 [Fusarium venenatum]KAG8353177.1 hypothetical protein FVEN_g12942 [Fusarium venenatum]CEI65665.1 unnamed protein product [Fusarium venenatum]